MICTLCYGNRPQAKRIPTGFPTEMGICTGCAIEMDKTLGYMALQGHGLLLNLEGTLHVINLETGQAWPTSYGTMHEFGDMLENAVKAPLPPADDASKGKPPKPE